MTHNTLKQQAKAFAAQHNLPYATALRAVDEPLHELRDLTQSTSQRGNGHFRLISRENDIYSSAVHEDSLPLADLESWLYNQPLAERTAILQESGAADVWQHRQLHRAGLTDQPMEMLVHRKGDVGQKYKLAENSHILLRAGIILVSHIPRNHLFADLQNPGFWTEDIEWGRVATPVTALQLGDLLAGNPSSVNEAFPSGQEVMQVAGVVETDTSTILLIDDLPRSAHLNGVLDVALWGSDTVTVNHLGDGWSTVHSSDGQSIYSGPSRDLLTHSESNPNPWLALILRGLLYVTGQGAKNKRDRSWVVSLGRYAILTEEMNAQLPQHKRWTLGHDNEGLIHFKRGSQTVIPLTRYDLLRHKVHTREDFHSLTQVKYNGNPHDPISNKLVAYQHMDSQDGTDEMVILVNQAPGGALDLVSVMPK